MLPAIIQKLVPRFASDFDGEVIATRNTIGQALRSAGLDWNDLAEACFSSRRPYDSASALPSFGDLARACRDLDEGRLTTRERGFVMQMCSLGFGYMPSQRQTNWLAAILGRLRRLDA